MDKAWKRFERRIAERFKEIDPTARRCPVADQATNNDIVTSLPYGIECKHRKRLPDWIRDAWAQCRANSKEDQVPIVILGEHGTTNDFVLLSLDDFIKITKQTAKMYAENWRSDDDRPDIPR